jgi:hypothetical protein
VQGVATPPAGLKAGFMAKEKGRRFGLPRTANSACRVEKSLRVLKASIRRLPLLLILALIALQPVLAHLVFLQPGLLADAQSLEGGRVELTGRL